MKKTILSVLGLFVPIKNEGEYVFTLQIGSIPLGWIIVGIALLVKYI